MFRFLVYRTGDRWLSEDLLADTFEKVLRSRGPASRGPGERPWLYTIALNCVRDGLRRNAAQDRALERVAAVSTAHGQEPGIDETLGDREEIQHALARLAADEREALALRFGADLTVPEVARVQGVSLTTAEGRVYRGLRKLRDLLS